MVYHTVYLLFAVFLPIGFYHRIQAARSGETIDRRQEGWPLLIGIRLSGIAYFAAVYAGFRQPPTLPPAVQWAGVALLAAALTWLVWMFVSLGPNLTDTVVTRRAAYFVSHGPYKYVRNPMYIGILVAGLALAAVLGSWLVALFASTCFVLLAIRTRTEERFLIARFGDTYKSYMSEVGRFLPYIL